VTGFPASAPTQTPSKAVGKLPALGWNSWNAYRCDINHDKVVAAAEAFITLGLKDVGYEYINIDDCWPLMARDSATGRMVPDPSKFPDGISGVASKVHGLGLKFGIYSDAGTTTCAGYPGSLGHEDVDAATWAEWGVDYLKYDNCNVPGNWSDSGTPQNNDWYNSNSAIRYRQMTAALDDSGRTFQLSICIWGAANVWTWGSRVGHSWRMSGDSGANWNYIKSILTTNTNYLDHINFYAHNDMDMMEIGNGDLTVAEQRTHFAAWCFLKSPILLGTDLSQLTAAELAIIKNTELLAFSQDNRIGVPAKAFTPYDGAPSTSPPEYYTGKSSKGVHVFAINIGDSAATKTFDFAKVSGLGSGRYVVHDMWTGKDLGTFSGNYSTSVDAHDTVAYYIKAA